MKLHSEQDFCWQWLDSLCIMEHMITSMLVLASLLLAANAVPASSQDNHVGDSDCSYGAQRSYVMCYRLYYNHSVSCLPVNSYNIVSGSGLYSCQ